MHIPDGYLDLSTAAGTFALAGAGLAAAARHVRARLKEATLPMMGLMSAFIFAGQMVNFPIAGGTSGHLLGAAMASVFLGPWAAMLVMATVIFVQCLFFQDGGITALGANLLNLAVVAPWVARALFGLTRWVAPQPRFLPAAAGMAGFGSILAAATLCCLELIASETARASTVLPVMTLLHAVIGLAEGVLTAGLVSFVVRLRPDLIASPGVVSANEATAAEGAGWRRPAWVLAALVGAALLAAPWASKNPDALEAVGGRLQLVESTPSAQGPLAGYSVAGVGASAGTALAGALGSGLAFGCAWVLLRRLKRP